jgi:hypothetical protein
MTAMLGTPSRTKRLTRAFVAALGAALIIGCGAGEVRADDEPFDTKLIKGFLRGLGLKDGTEAEIQYRERSPLVVPPTRELPPPEGVATPRNPAWPTDVDEKKRRAAAADRDRRVISPEESARALRPDELERGRVARPAESKPVITPEEAGRPLPPSALGSKSLIDLFRGSDAEEKGTFVTEPPRNTLIQPPPGYRTPSPGQPYGVGTKSAPKGKPATLEDRAAGETR